MRRLLEAYQYVMPAVLTPLGALLWWRHYDGHDYDGHVALAAIAVLVPIAHAYIVPGIGTNVLRMWEFDTRLRLGRFRPHHGFVFGSATAVLMPPALGTPTAHPTLADMATSGLAAAVILGAVNWLYDVAAIRAGILGLQPALGGWRGPIAVVNDYAPWFFGGFGLVQGRIKFAEGVRCGRRRGHSCGRVGVGRDRHAADAGYVLQSYRSTAITAAGRARAENDHGELARSGGHRTAGKRPGADADAGARPHRSRQAVRAEPYTQLYYTPVYTACIASTGCATTSCSACASTNTS